MQCRRQHGGSGELDVFAATRYFAGLADCATVTKPADGRLIQAKVMHDTRMGESFRGPHGHEQLMGVHGLQHQAQLGLSKPAGKSKIAAFLGFMVSPSPEASFRKKPPPPPTSRSAAGEEPAKVSSSTSRESNDDASVTAASMQLHGCGYGLDLGAATGDRRLQGVRVVRGSGDEEKWVVRCGSCWEEERHEEMFDAATSSDHNDHQVEEGGDGNKLCKWDSDSSSNLFDLDLEYVDLST